MEIAAAVAAVVHKVVAEKVVAHRGEAAVPVAVVAAKAMAAAGQAVRATLQVAAVVMHRLAVAKNRATEHHYLA